VPDADAQRRCARTSCARGGILFNDARQFAPERLANKLLAAAERRRRDLERALEVVSQELQECLKRRDAALDAVAERSLPEAVRSAMIQRAEAAVHAYEELESQQHALRAGMEVLNEQTRTIERILTSPLLDPARWKEPAVAQIIKRALHLLIHKAVLVEEKRGAYHIELWLYREEFLLFRESVANESAWGSNPPTRLVTPPTGFEDQGSHRATSALVSILAA
jgi:hypothetical protein